MLEIFISISLVKKNAIETCRNSEQIKHDKNNVMVWVFGQ